MSKTILVVDDEPDIVDLLQQRLAARNYKVLKAYDGEQAIEIIKQQLPDLIILDVLMPRLNGIETFQKLQNDPVAEKIPVIFLTAMISRQDESTLTARLGIPYVPLTAKPFEGEKILSKIKELLNE